jgi:hypothetical protein
MFLSTLCTWDWLGQNSPMASGILEAACPVLLKLDHLSPEAAFATRKGEDDGSAIRSVPWLLGIR